MKRRVVHITAALLISVTLSTTLRAQDPFPIPIPGGQLVFDPSNWYENVLQVIGLIDELKAWTYLFTRLPLDLVNRYRTLTRPWPVYTFSGVRFASPWLGALNAGDPSGFSYRQLLQTLDIPDDVLTRMPVILRQRFQADYGAVEAADRVATMGIDQVGNTRLTSPNLLAVIQAMQDDAASSSDDFLSETALLTKINTASALSLRIGEKTNEFLAAALEQLTLDNTRRRETEAALLNATIKQWRYGQALGDSMFQNTAANIDGWRLR
jgi:hypothetical protein